ncbi:DUF6624 domain-containing protein [Sphingomonas fuzhouensis]|uniref:DUF6624 domain-containing protein n=1 Tax=Sphingomonas fuzhouensis TaxID=3106033 RepID=UPI002AFE6590|nr:DUF6624 domain-containing protein [Sphingomonas sp. SGZ-02]
MRVLTLIFSLFLLTAATPPVPDVVKPYIDGGRFNPGDYKWMKGRFADATAAEKAQAKQVQAWLMACYESDLAQVRTELRALGVVDPKMNNNAGRDPLCAQVGFAPDPTRWPSFEAFQRSVQEATPIADTYLMAVNVAKTMGAAHTPKLHDILVARPLAEQMLRVGAGWGEGDMAKAPPVSEDVKAVIVSRIGTANALEDHENTEWLKALVARNGWPKRSEVGEDAAEQAWLLAQHADADPAFQLSVLRAMEPLVPSGEVSKSDYAYLYDRVMLKIAGKQRYGTQAMCLKGRRLAQPLEDETAVDRLRAGVGLDPLASYLKNMDASYGHCPPDRQ